MKNEPWAAFANRLAADRNHRREGYPSRFESEEWLVSLSEFLFPHFCRPAMITAVDDVDRLTSRLVDQLHRLLKPVEGDMAKPIETVVARFFDEVPQVYAMLMMDAEAILNGDPAAESIDEVIAAYPGFYAIFAYRVAHVLSRDGVPIFPRLLTEYAHRITGVDIHPAARIGKSFCIDHATGIVIGETTTVGDRVKLYQGVTLGALSVSKEMSKRKRHPTIEDDVVIYANATILGGETTIGHHSIVGGNAWLTESVEPYSIVFNTAEIHVQRQFENAGEDYEIRLHSRTGPQHAPCSDQPTLPRASRGLDEDRTYESRR